MSVDLKNFLSITPEITARERAKPDVVIVVAPFANSSSPAIGPSLLMAGCQKRNINCRIFYANLILAAILGHELYQRVSWNGDCLIGDAIFAPYAFPAGKDELICFISDKDNSARINLSIEDYYKIDEVIPEYLNYVSQRLIGTGARIIGFSSLYNQNTSSIAIAGQLKQANPEIITAIGGSSVTNPMGRALSEIAPMLDTFFSGEADTEFPRFCDDILNNRLSSSSIPKMIDCSSATDMDSVEIPVFEDYFEQLSALQGKDLLPGDWPDRIPFESSRGCWWGQKSTCSFCGLNTINIKYRKKNRTRIIDEIAHLRRKHNVDSFTAVDCVMPEHFEGELNDLSELDEGLSIFYEVRPTVQPPLLDVFVKAGIVSLQPGIESLSSNVLKRMRKGVTALQNIKLLREARSRQIALTWNLLVGTPGETEEDYEQLLEILPSIEHFQPPQGLGPVTIHRYSPYFSDPSKYNIRNVRPNAIYNLIYPTHANLEELAYTFEADCESIRTSKSDIFKRLIAHFGQWAKLWEKFKDRPRLYFLEKMNDVRMIKDTRRLAEQRFTALDKGPLELLYRLSEPARTESIPELFRPHLEELLKRKFVIHYEEHYLSLVTDPAIGIGLRKRTWSKA